jgi:hypothetical protein
MKDYGFYLLKDNTNLSEGGNIEKPPFTIRSATRPVFLHP